MNSCQPSPKKKELSALFTSTRQDLLGGLLSMDLKGITPLKYLTNAGGILYMERRRLKLNKEENKALRNEIIYVAVPDFLLHNSILEC